jgi:hypothetical protein
MNKPFSLLNRGEKGFFIEIQNLNATNEDKTEKRHF